jgi:ThiF family protein
MHHLDYSRQAGAADLDILRDTEVCQVGEGSGNTLTKTLVRMGVSRIKIIDPDVVEFRNITSQGYTHDDARLGRSKVEALARECLEINPKLDVEPIQADFLALKDSDIKRLLTAKTILLMATDFHPAQARGALAGLVTGVPVVLASLYREGKAGEIIFTYPGRTKACYRCIAASRYDHVARRRGTGTGSANGSLPFAAQFVDAIVGHLTIALLHKWRGAEHNRFARWIDELGQRNFIQVRMDPGYKLGDEDIFGESLGRGDRVFAFDSIWQSGLSEVKSNCPDCHGYGAAPPEDRRAESTEIEQHPCGCLTQRGTPHECTLELSIAS